MTNKHESLVPGSTYHIYNRAVGNEKIFLNEGNYDYFLYRYRQFLLPYLDTFCYCLLPNHFHLLVQVKKVDDLPIKTLLGLKNHAGFNFLSFRAQQELIETRLSKQFSNFFNAYTKALNKQNKRMGSLFIRPYKRILVTDETYLRNLVCYIHNNPVEARLCYAPEEWKYSSYSLIKKGESSFLKPVGSIEKLGGYQKTEYTLSPIQ